MKKFLLCLLLLCLTLCAVSAGAEQLPSGIDLSGNRELITYFDENEARELRGFYNGFISSQVYLYDGEFYLSGSQTDMYGLPVDDETWFINLPTIRKGCADVTDEGLEVVFDEIKTVVGVGYDFTNRKKYLLLSRKPCAGFCGNEGRPHRPGAAHAHHALHQRLLRL